MNMDYTAIGTWVALITALFAVIAIWVEGKRSRFSQGLDILIAKNNQYNRVFYFIPCGTYYSDANYAQSLAIAQGDDYSKYYYQFSVIKMNCSFNVNN